MKAQEILNSRKENEFLKYENEIAQWYSISRDNNHIITFYGGEEIVYKFYKNEKSYATRVSQLMRRGY